ncbi:helix-turn-helix domain-containing protein [Neorhizobium sp. SHOUNA12B]|uniref:helix-turn-helix domain-containing protein n=1 Tax=Neorhizobium sp. SHOUNA12B TaxID=2908928 RepID=UPI0025D79C0D|nr:helix-turn-helix domain-containing protein [Neorhizobium sp. SHOUNA12B]MCJ9670401.1 helix-turn-helix domain-containing protein [Neorhizobium sp. SHOUNA12B]
MTLEELSEKLGVHRQTAYDWLRRGKLKGRLEKVTTNLACQPVSGLNRNLIRRVILAKQLKWQSQNSRRSCESEPPAASI